MVTNAVAHGHGPVQVRISLDNERVRLDVTDQGRAGSQPAAAEDQGVGGWGLRLIDDVSDAWGLRRDRGGTHVWMERRAEGRRRDLGQRPT
jgi:anti-sigma regulatory factor (Ser/Thr protein kinase)